MKLKIKCVSFVTFLHDRLALYSLALLLLVSLPLSVLLSPTALAASPYDNFVQITDDYTLEANNYYNNYYSGTDVSDWRGELENNDWWANENAKNDLLPQIKSIQQSPSASVAVIRVTEFQQGNIERYASNFYIYFCDEPLDVTFTYSVFATCNGTGKSVAIFSKAIWLGYGGGDPVFADIGSPANSPMSTPVNTNNTGEVEFRIVETANLDVTYPPDYAGLPIPGISLEQLSYYPEITLNVRNKNINVRYNGNIERELAELPYPPDYPSGYTIKWKLERQISTSPLEYELVNEKELSKDVAYEYDVDQLSTYRITASPVVPFYEEANILVNSTSLPFVVDGTSYTQTAGGKNCVNGVCEQETQYDDCSTYGVNVAGAIICVFGNFQKWLISTLMWLFIPNAGNVSNYSTAFVNVIREKMGFVWTGFSFIVDWLKTLLVTDTHCTFATNGTFFGANINLNFCQLEQASPTIYNMMIGFLRLLFGAVLVFFSYRRFMHIITTLGKS